MSEPQRARPATIRDVAREAGVSTSTVSRILDDRVAPAQSATADRVRNAAQALGYRKDAYASAMRRQSTNTVGVLVPRLTDTVMAIMFEEIASACSKRGSFAVVGTTHDDPDEQRVAAERLLSQRVDALILTTARVDDDFTKDLRARGVSLVLALRTDGANPAAVGDDDLGGYLAARHLIDLGHRRIGLVGGPSYASSAVNRRRGFERALGEASLPSDPQIHCSSSFGMESGEEIATHLLQLSDPPTAIFAVNDNTALGVLAAARKLGVHVPNDLSVVGYNDIPTSAQLPIPLTSVRVPFDQIAAAAVEMLSADSTGAPPAQKVFAPTLIPRLSTAAV